MPKHNTEKGWPGNQTAPWHWNIKEQTSPFCSRRVIPKSKGFNLDDNTKNKKYHHQEDCYHETTQKKQKDYKHSNIYVLQQLVIYTIEKRLIKSELRSYIDI